MATVKKPNDRVCAFHGLRCPSLLASVTGLGTAWGCFADHCLEISFKPQAIAELSTSMYGFPRRLHEGFAQFFYGPHNQSTGLVHIMVFRTLVL